VTVITTASEYIARARSGVLWFIAGVLVALSAAHVTSAAGATTGDHSQVVIVNLMPSTSGTHPPSTGGRVGLGVLGP